MESSSPITEPLGQDDADMGSHDEDLLWEHVRRKVRWAGTGDLDAFWRGMRALKGSVHPSVYVHIVRDMLGRLEAPRP